METVVGHVHAFAGSPPIIRDEGAASSLAKEKEESSANDACIRPEWTQTLRYVARTQCHKPKQAIWREKHRELPRKNFSSHRFCQQGNGNQPFGSTERGFCTLDSLNFGVSKFRISEDKLRPVKNGHTGVAQVPRRRYQPLGRVTCPAKRTSPVSWSMAANKKGRSSLSTNASWPSGAF